MSAVALSDDDRTELQTLGEELNKPENFLRRYGRGDVGKWEVFDVLCFTSAKKDKMNVFGACAWSLRIVRITMTLVWSSRCPRVLPPALEQVSTEAPLNPGILLTRDFAGLS